MHVWIVDQEGRSRELHGQEIEQLVRSLLNAVVRTKAEMLPDLLSHISALQSKLVEDYRRPAESEIEPGIRHAVLPLLAGIVTD